MTSAGVAYCERDHAALHATARPWRIAYVVSHPIQYQAPLLRFIAAQPDFDLTVFFQSEGALAGQLDPGFGRVVRWDVPLLDGYRHEFLPAFGRRDVISTFRPLSYGIAGRLRRGDFDAVWVHGYARAVSWQAMLAAKAAGLKIFIRDDVTEAGRVRGRSRRAAKQVFCRLLAQIADGFLATGTANAEYYRAHGVPARRIFLLPYAVDNAFFASRAKAAEHDRENLRAGLGLKPGRPVILFASKFQALKRPDDLLLAYERLIESAMVHKPPYLLFVGDGELRPLLEAAAKRLSGIRVLGFRNQTELPAFYDLCDVFVLPSSTERWGLVVNEVMAVGRAVVVSDKVGCAADLIKPGVNGFVFPFGDVAALTQALRDVLSSPERSRAMGAASREIIDQWSFREDVEGLRRALQATVHRARTPEAELQA
jgi:glycosyltransferase involved in cell wall biosynthesis